MIKFAKVAFMSDKVLKTVPIEYIKMKKTDETCIAPTDDQDFHPDRIVFCRSYNCTKGSVLKCDKEEGCSHQFDYFSIKIRCLGSSPEDVKLKMANTRRVKYPTSKVFSSDSSDTGQLQPPALPNLLKIKQEKDIDINASMLKTSQNQLQKWKANSEPGTLSKSLNLDASRGTFRNPASFENSTTMKRGASQRVLSTTENQSSKLASNHTLKRRRVQSGPSRRELIEITHRQEIELAKLKNSHQSNSSKPTDATSTNASDLHQTLPTSTDANRSIENGENKDQATVEGPRSAAMLKTQSVSKASEIPCSGSNENNNQQEGRMTIDEGGSIPSPDQVTPSSSSQQGSRDPAVQSSCSSASVQPAVTTAMQSINNTVPDPPNPGQRPICLRFTQRSVAASGDALEDIDEMDSAEVCALVMSREMGKALEGYKPLPRNELGVFTKKRPLKRKYTLVLYSVHYYRNPQCPGHPDFLQRYVVTQGMKYLGENIVVCELYWNGVSGNKSPTEFLRALMGIFWKPHDLCNLSLEPESCRPDKFIPGRSRPEQVEFEKLRLLISLYDDYLNKKFKNTKMKYLMDATTIMSNHFRDSRLEARKKALEAARNPVESEI